MGTSRGPGSRNIPPLPITATHPRRNVSIVLESTVLEPSLAADEALVILQAVADPIRWRVLDELASCTTCVCDLQAKVDIAPNLLSYHLKVLRDAGLVIGTRRGRWIDYALAADADDLIRAALPGTRKGC